MWSRQMLSLYLLAIAINSSLAGKQKLEANSSRVPVFIQSLKKLHRGLPIPTSVTRSAIAIEWIEQKLDHFDENERRTWKMRYMVNDEHFKEGGPMFIMVGGESEILPNIISGGHFYDMAKEHNAILFQTEHRYYGESMPLSDLTVQNLRYLSVKQALADLAYFINYKKESVPALANAKVILAGGSYPGSMVIWFKRLYPELLNGGWASSAPILAKVNFMEYFEIIGQSVRELGSPKCYERIKNGFEKLENMIFNKRAAEIKAMLKICNNFDENNNLDVQSLFFMISNLFAQIGQYQLNNDIPKLCDILLKFQTDDAAIASIFLRYIEKDQTGCFDLSYKTMLNYYLDTKNQQDWSRIWTYQTCNEFGWFQTSDSKAQPFGENFPLEFHIKMCADIFGEKYTLQTINMIVNETNLNFGGMNPEVERIYITHGALDPWSPMGLNQEQGATILPRASHCTDFSSISDADDIELKASKKHLAELISNWLKD